MLFALCLTTFLPQCHSHPVSWLAAILVRSSATLAHESKTFFVMFIFRLLYNTNSYVINIRFKDTKRYQRLPASYAQKSFLGHLLPGIAIGSRTSFVSNQPALWVSCWEAPRMAHPHWSWSWNLTMMLRHQTVAGPWLYLWPHDVSNSIHIFCDCDPLPCT